MTYRIVTFRDTGYSNPKRFEQQAAELQRCVSTSVYSEFHLWRELLPHLGWIASHRRDGFGQFVWKPSVIQKAISQTQPGDFTIYLDLGVHINSKAERRILDYLDQMDSDGTELGVFSTGPAYIRQDYVKADAVYSYWPEFFQTRESYLYAGIVIVRKGRDADVMLRDWGRLVAEKNFLSRKPSRRHQEPESFIGNDLDNALLSLVLSKHRKSVTVFGHNEVNLYSKDGLQLKHVLSDHEYSHVDWASLDDKPFQYRRDR